MIRPQISGRPDERTAQAEARIGLTLRGKYRIERLLGVGGMASVYAASHRNGRKVAVKMLHSAISLRRDVMKRFLQEGQAANAVNHPGVVAVIDDDVAEDGAAFLVMELLEGDVVEHVWKRNGARLPLDVVLAIGYELCGVLDAAHEAGIVHRDLKPGNLIVTREAQLKVLDFGFAQLRNAERFTAVGTVFGTPAFMSPEQANGRVGQVDARSDIWAVGATLFTLLSGLTVHRGGSPQEVLVAAATKPAPSLRTALPEAPARVVSLVDRALAVDKDARWPNADAMRAAIFATHQALFHRAPTLTPLDGLRGMRAPDISIVDLTGSSDYGSSDHAHDKTTASSDEDATKVHRVPDADDEAVTTPREAASLSSSTDDHELTRVTPNRAFGPPTPARAAKPPRLNLPSLPDLSTSTYPSSPGQAAAMRVALAEPPVVAPKPKGSTPLRIAVAFVGAAILAGLAVALVLALAGK